jgi:hypothetical protein
MSSAFEKREYLFLCVRVFLTLPNFRRCVCIGFFLPVK